MNEDDPEEQLEDHVKDDNVDEDVDEDAHVNEGVQLVGDDESNTDDNFNIFGQGVQQDKSKDESEDESVEEDNAPINNPVEDPVEDRSPLMVRRLDSDLDGIGREYMCIYGFSHDGRGTGRGTHDERIL